MGLLLLHHAHDTVMLPGSCPLHLVRATLVSDMSTNKALLKKLEDTLLRELSNATGNILDNQELIATLESAKEKAVDISHKLTAAKATAKDIEEARVRYSPAATRGAVLFFVMAGLSAVNNMYEYSLAAFLKVFKQVRTLRSLQSTVLCQQSTYLAPSRSAEYYSVCGGWVAVLRSDQPLLS